jgi:peptidoglycan/LPS O-acetylase OafA/YrhL
MLDKLYFIQSLRGIAVLMVVFWHASRYLGNYGEKIGGKLFMPGGQLGVDLFFMISGFIMVHITRDSRDTMRDSAVFLIKRISRVIPVYFSLTLLYLLVQGSLISYLMDSALTMHLMKSFLFIPQGGGLAPDFGQPVLGVGWSLNYEMYFYFVFGTSMLFGRWRWHAMAVWFSITLIAPGIYFSEGGDSINLSPYRTYPLPPPYRW